MIVCQKWDHRYSLKGCKGSNIQDSALLEDGGPDIRGSVQFGHELMFPSWKLKKGSVRIGYLIIVLFALTKCVQNRKNTKLKFPK